jgi:excisionase family DNA binding protein
MKVPKYYTTFQASRLLGVSLPTVVNYIKSGILKAHKTPGGHRRISEHALVAFAAEYDMPLTPEITERRGPHRILWVDDDPDFLELAQEMLRAETSWEIRAVESGFQAGMAVASWKPDLVLMDLEMPNMDGFAALEEIRNDDDRPGLPVIACTGLRGGDLSERIETSGFSGCIQKPVDFAALIDQLRGMLPA